MPSKFCRVTPRQSCKLGSNKFNAIATVLNASLEICQNNGLDNKTLHVFSLVLFLLKLVFELGLAGDVLTECCLML